MDKNEKLNLLDEAEEVSWNILKDPDSILDDATPYQRRRVELEELMAIGEIQLIRSRLDNGHPEAAN